MTSNEAEQIIQEFGKVLEVASAIGLAIPEQFLPYSKKEIKDAFFHAYKTSSSENKQILASCYMRLPEFIPMDDALLVFRYTNWLTNEEKTKNIEDQELRNDWQKIMNKINKEMEEYMAEITKLD